MPISRRRTALLTRRPRPCSDGGGPCQEAAASAAVAGLQGGGRYVVHAFYTSALARPCGGRVAGARIGCAKPRCGVVLSLCCLRPLALRGAHESVLLTLTRSGASAARAEKCTSFLREFEADGEKKYMNLLVLCAAGGRGGAEGPMGVVCGSNAWPIARSRCWRSTSTTSSRYSPSVPRVRLCRAPHVRGVQAVTGPSARQPRLTRRYCARSTSRTARSSRTSVAIPSGTSRSLRRQSTRACLRRHASMSVRRLRARALRADCCSSHRTSRTCWTCCWSSACR